MPFLRFDHARAAIAPLGRAAVWLWIAQTLAACDSGLSPGGTAPSPQPVLPQPMPTSSPASHVHGHFRGGAATGDATYYVDALITLDGDVRMHVAGPFDVGTVHSGGGFPVLADLAESVQFVGNIEPIGDGEGVVLGQICTPSHPGRFCDAAAPASISIAGAPPLPGNPNYMGVTGEVRVTTDQGEEVWLLDLAAWSIYYDPDPYVSPTDPYRGPSGSFQERLAGFAQAEDTIVTVDSAGRLFFQSPESGCVGNGTLTRRSGYYVFDAEILIENCGQSYAFQNGEYQGLATETQSSYWDYDNSLLMFLSAPEGSAPRAAITMLGSAIYCSQADWWAGTCD